MIANLKAAAKTTTKKTKKNSTTPENASSDLCDMEIN